MLAAPARPVTHICRSNTEQLALVARPGSLICDVDSDDELSAIIGRDPLFFHSCREVYPLTTADTHKKYVQEMIKG